MPHLQSGCCSLQVSDCPLCLLPGPLDLVLCCMPHLSSRGPQHQHSLRASSLAYSVPNSCTGRAPSDGSVVRVADVLRLMVELRFLDSAVVALWLQYALQENMVQQSQCLSIPQSITAPTVCMAGCNAKERGVGPGRHPGCRCPAG